MIQITPQMRILVARQPVDFRKGIDGLAALCRQVLKVNPMDGALFLFCNRRGHAIKVLVYDGQGFWLCQKRLSNGRFKGWPKGEDAVQTLDAHQVQLLLWNGDPMHAKAANWIELGQTVGRGTKCPTQKQNRPIKTHWVYPIHRRFRDLLQA